MFLNTNDRIVNLSNVSNINIDKTKNRKRIVFNLNYSIEIIIDSNNANREPRTKLISDYIYWDAINDENLTANLAYIKESKYFTENFIPQINETGFINLNEISSVKYADKKNRVIFNLSHPVTFRDHDCNDRITSEFVYVNCGSYMEYREYREYINTLIGER